MFRKTILAALAVAASLFTLTSPARADGLIVITNPNSTVPGHFSFAPLEVTYHKVNCDIKDQVAVTSVDQEFYNPNDGRPLEGEYIFPIPKDGQINKFAMEIDGKPVEAELLPAEKARGIYEEIVRQSKDPALLEYAGRAMFKVRIFPIEAHSKKKVTLKYTEFLKQDANLLDYHYTLNTEKYSSKPIKNISMKITIETTSPITTLYSPTHEVERNKKDDTHAVVGFEAKDVRPDTDFHLYIGRKAAPVGISVLTYKPDADKDGYFVLMAAPTVNKDVKPLPKDVVFVVDTSGSMSGAKMEQAKKALKFCVNTMNPGDRFDIVRFSTEAEPFFRTLTAYNDDSKAKALKFIDDMRAAGGTAIEDALKASLEEVRPKAGEEIEKSRTASLVPIVVFLTDGQPTIGEQNVDKLLDQAKKEATAGSTPVRLFSFGIGTDVNTKLLDQLADQLKGYSQYVLPQEDIEVAVSNFFGKVQDPIIAGVKCDMSAVNALKLYPKEMPDLFKGDQLVVFGTYSKSAKTAVALKGLVNGKEETFAQDVDFPEKTDSSNEWIAKLWATRRVGYLLDEIRLRGESKETKDEVVELARKWGIVTPYTAMLIIEDERRRNVPVAVRSLREMETDGSAVAFSARAVDALAKKEDNGNAAVNMTISNGTLKTASNLQSQADNGAQLDPRLRNSDDASKPMEKAAIALAKDAAVSERLAALSPSTQAANTPTAAPATIQLQEAQVASAESSTLTTTGTGGAAGPAGSYTHNGGIVSGDGGGFGGGGRAGRGTPVPGGLGGGVATGNTQVTAGTLIIPSESTFNGGTLVTGGKTVIVNGSEKKYDAKELNLGNQSTNGWNYNGSANATVAAGAAAEAPAQKQSQGYRVINNYAQQNRVINNRAFYLNGNQWTDNNVQNLIEKKKDTPKTKIVFGSADYFNLLKDHPEAAQYMSLGGNVTFEINGAIYDIVDESPADTNPQTPAVITH